MESEEQSLHYSNKLGWGWGGGEGLPGYNIIYTMVGRWVSLALYSRCLSVQSSCAKNCQSAKRKLGEVEQGKASASCAAQFCHPADRNSEVKIALVYPPYPTLCPLL